MITCRLTYRSRIRAFKVWIHGRKPMPMCLDSDGISTKDTHGTDVFVCDEVENLIYLVQQCAIPKSATKWPSQLITWTRTTITDPRNDHHRESPEKGNPYGPMGWSPVGFLSCRWHGIPSASWCHWSCGSLHKSALEFRGFQPPQGLVGEWRKREVFPEIANSSMLLEDYFHSHNLAGESLYLRILRERSQQIYCASETCWNIFHFPPQKGRWLIPSTFPHSKRHMWRYQIGVCVEPFLTEFFVKVVQPEIRPKKNICLKSLNRIREVEFSFVWKVFFIDLGGQTGGKRVVTPKPRIKTVETRKGARFHRSDVTFIISTKS